MLNINYIHDCYRFVFIVDEFYFIFRPMSLRIKGALRAKFNINSHGHETLEKFTLVSNMKVANNQLCEYVNDYTAFEYYQILQLSSIYSVLWNSAKLHCCLVYNKHYFLLNIFTN